MTAHLAHWSCDHPTCDRSGSGTWSQVDTSAARHHEDSRHNTTTRTVGSVRVRDSGGRAGCAGGGWVVSELTAFRDHCRTSATSDHAPGCERGKPSETYARFGMPRVWTCSDRRTDHGEHRWADDFGIDWTCPGWCTGCLTDADRALFARLADEVDAYLAGDDSDVDLFGDETPLPEADDA